MKPAYHTDYLQSLINPRELRKNIAWACKFLKQFDFDTIAFRGMSGALLAIPIALRMKKELIMVRKPGENTHSKYQVEGNINVQKYVIVDDFVFTGDTVRSIYDAVLEFTQDREQPPRSLIKLDTVICLGVLEITKHRDRYDTTNRLMRIPDRT